MRLFFFFLALSVCFIQQNCYKTRVFDYFEDADGTGLSLNLLRSLGKAAVMYMVKGCSNCQRMHPQFLNLAKKLPVNHTFIVMDCQHIQNYNICVSEGLKLVPMFNFWRDGVRVSAYYDGLNFISKFVPMVLNDTNK